MKDVQLREKVLELKRYCETNKDITRMKVDGELYSACCEYIDMITKEELGTCEAHIKEKGGSLKFNETEVFADEE